MFEEAIAEPRGLPNRQLLTSISIMVFLVNLDQDFLKFNSQ